MERFNIPSEDDTSDKGISIEDIGRNAKSVFTPKQVAPAQPKFKGIEESEDSTRPRPIKTELNPVQKLTPEMIPAPLRSWVYKTAQSFPCPVDYIAVSSICLAGALIGAKCSIKPKPYSGKWEIVPNIWGGIVGEPSSFKTPSISSVFGLIKPLEIEARKVFDVDRRQAHASLQVIEQQKKKILNGVNAKSNPIAPEDASEQIAELEEQAELLKPRLKRYIVNDTTPEKLQDICGENPQGVLVFRDELIGLFKQWEKKGNEDARALYLEAWEGTKDYKKDRVVKGSTFIDNLCISLFGGIVPDKIHEYVKSTSEGENDGLLQRLQLLIYPNGVDFDYIDEPTDKDEQEEVFTLFKQIAEEPDFISYGARQQFDKRPYFLFSPEAQNLFIEWLKNLHKEKESGDYSTYEIQHLMKYPSLLPSLALIFQIIEFASGNASQQTRGDVSKESVLMAIKWIDYLKSHALRIYGLSKDESKSAYELSKRISAGKVPNEFKVRDIQQNGWHLLGSKDQITEAIKELISANWIREIEQDKPVTGRPPAPLYQIHPEARNFYKK